MKYAISLQHLVIRKQSIRGKHDVMIRIYPISLLVLISVLASHFGQAQELRLVMPVGHTGSVNSAQFSPDGMTIVTASVDNTAKVWDVATGKELHSLEGHSDWVRSAQFSPDGKTIVTASEDHTAKVWDVATGKELHSLEGHSYYVTSAQFSPDGKTIITASDDDTAKVWDVATGKELLALEGHSKSVNSAQFSPDGKTIVTDSWDNTARVWDVATGKELHSLEGHSDFVNSAQFSPDGKTIVTASDDYTAKVWDVATGKELHSLEGHSDDVTSAQFSPDGKTIVTASEDHTAKVWDVASGKELHSLEGHSRYVRSAQFSPDGKTIVTASWDNTAKVWDVATGKELHSLEGHSNWVTSAQFSPDGKTIVTTAPRDYSAKVWEAATGMELNSLEGHSVPDRSAQFSPGRMTILTAAWDSTAKVWDVTTGKELHSLEGHSSDVTSAQFSPDGKTIVTASYDYTAKVWDVATGKELHSLEGHSDWVRSAQFSPDGKTIVTASEDHTAKVWDVATGMELHSLEGHSSDVTSAQFSPDGMTIVIALDSTAKVWDVATGKELHSLEGHSSWVKSALFSPDGKTIVTASFDKTAKVWDVATGMELHSLEGHLDFVTSAQFRPDGMTIVTASGDKTAKVWDVATGKELHALEGHNDLILSAQFNPDGKFIVTASLDHTARVWDVATGKELHALEGHNDKVISAPFSPDGKTIVTASNDDIAKVWDATTGQLLYSRLTLEGDGWLAWDPEYRYDGTPEAIEQMHFACGLEVIELEQAKGALYTPNLVSRIMAGEDLSPLKGLDDLDLCGRTPIVTPLPGEGRGQRFDIEPRKGGVETAEVFIDGVRRYSFPASALETDEHGHYLLTLTEAQVSEFAASNEVDVRVVARTEDGLTSRGGSSVLDFVESIMNDEQPPALHGLFVGINDYKGEALQLQYAAADARELGEVIQAAAGKLLGEDNVHVTTLLSDAASGAVANPPEKHRVLAELEAIAERSELRDILVIHLAGHGSVNEQGEFVFLTSEANSLEQGEFTGITMQEINDALMSVKAANRILILDACHSGEAINDALGEGQIAFAATKRATTALVDDVARGRQVSRLGDNANLTMIAASASDQAAYEMPEFGHGLLTYALLEAIQNHGDILSEDAFLELKPWIFQAEKTVNQQAQGPGRQAAQTLMPANYPIGAIDDRVRGLIQLDVKAVINAITLRNRATRFDDLALGPQVEAALKTAPRGSTPALFIPDSPSGITIDGKYTLTPDGTLTLSCEAFNASGFLGEMEWSLPQDSDWGKQIGSWVSTFE